MRKGIRRRRGEAGGGQMKLGERGGVELREGLGSWEGRGWGARVRVGKEGSRSPGGSHKDVPVALDLLDLFAANKDLQLAAPSFDGVEVHLNLDGMSSHQRPNAESQRTC